MEAQLQEALKDRYEVGRKLGVGGMGTVFLARDLLLERDVAIKVLTPGLASGVGAARFLREIRITARLQHPNIVPLHDSGSVGSDLYYVMPHIEGESLKDRLRREGPLAEADAVRIAREVADGLEYAHRASIIHRDIKPGNILLSSGHAMIADFGVARALSEAGDRLTTSHGAVGTAYYAAPEQLLGEETVDARTDVYALGCVLYEMLAGEPPFTGRSAQSVAARHLVEPPPPLEVVRRNLDRSTIEVVSRALEKVPADRFASAADLARALTEAGPVPRRRAAEGRIPDWLKVAAVLVLVGGLVAIWQAVRPPSGPLDDDKIVVFPLADSRDGAADTDEGWGVAIAIGSAFEHASPLKWIDGWSRLGEDERADPRALSPERARSVAIDRQARYYVDGVISSGPDGNHVSLRLNDVAGDSMIVQASAAGPAAPSLLGLRAVTGLLPSLIAQREIDLSSIEDREPAAIALWLEGEVQYRRAQFLTALDLHRRAVEEDSLLVFAAVRGAQAAAWKDNAAEAARLLDQAERHAELLPDRYGELVRGIRHYLAGRADSAIAVYRGLLAADPEWHDAAMALGEVYHHLLPARAATADSLAERWFARASALDPDFTPPLVHLAEYALRRGRVPEAEALIRRLGVVESDSLIVWRLSLMRRCVDGDLSTGDWDEAARVSYNQVGLAAKALSAGGHQARCAEDAFRAVRAHTAVGDTWNWAALVGLGGLLVGRERDAEAARVFEEAIEGGESGGMALYLLSEVAGADMRGRARETSDFARELWGPDYATGMARSRWLVGLWQAYHEGGGDVEAIEEALGEQAARSGAVDDASMASSLGVHAALARGDTAAVLSRLSDLATAGTREQVAFGLAPPLAPERILLAELLLARGEAEEALSEASVFDHPAPIAFLPFLSRSLRLRAEAAERLGRPELARAFEDRLARLRGTGDAPRGS